MSQTSVEAITDSVKVGLEKQRAINKCVARGAPEYKILRLSNSEAYPANSELKVQLIAETSRRTQSSKGVLEEIEVSLSIYVVEPTVHRWPIELHIFPVCARVWNNGVRFF